MLGFKSFEAALNTLTGIELMHMIKKRQMRLLVVKMPDTGRFLARFWRCQADL